MATSTRQKSAEGLQGLIEGLQENEKAALDAVKRFVDTVNDTFPDIGEDGPRRKIIDAAFQMTQQVVEASNRLAINVVDVTESTLRGMAEREDAKAAA
ncbi:MAG: hypothetical protein JST64_07735 [Actinobacteria bacterium]|nr:hypothetical protein [Actinomycetota bacterium]